MLKIRKDQLEALSEPALDAYIERVKPHLKKKFPDRCDALGEEGVEAVVRKAARTGRDHGLEGSPDVTALASLLLVFGEDLLDKPDTAWAKDILASKVIAPKEKIPMILDRLAAE